MSGHVISIYFVIGLFGSHAFLEGILLLKIRPLHQEELKDAYALEKEGYPADEAASEEILTYRNSEAPELNRGCYHGEDLVGFISATRYHESTLKEEAMHMHIPNGESICLHSVCVKESRRRQGIATCMLKEFIDYVRTEEKGAVRILLICKSKLIPLYTRVGFVFKCKSEVVHGKETWYELEIKLKDTNSHSGGFKFRNISMVNGID